MRNSYVWYRTNIYHIIDTTNKFIDYIALLRDFTFLPIYFELNSIKTLCGYKLKSSTIISGWKFGKPHPNKWTVLRLCKRCERKL
jgi:hypothetical protein